MIKNLKIREVFKNTSKIDLLSDYDVIPNDMQEQSFNDIKLKKMRLDVEASKVKGVTIQLPFNSTLHFTKNLWIPYGNYCRNIQLIGKNSVLQCNNIANPSGNDGGIGTRPWGLADHFCPYEYEHLPKGTQPSYGYNFKTTMAGKNFVELKSKLDIKNFSEGCRVLLHGKNKQNLGYPPNLEYHEYGKIDYIDYDKGVIYLNNLIKYSYDEQWHDIGPSYNKTEKWGKPRIVNLDDLSKSFALDYFRVVDVYHKLSANPKSPDLTAQYMSTQGSIYCEFIKCFSEGQIGVSQNCHVQLIDCEPKFFGDIDKLLGSVYIENIKTRSSIEPATGADYVFINGGECGKKLRLSSKHFDVNDLDIYKANKYGGIVIEPSSTNISGKISNVRLHYNENVIGIINIPLDRKFTPDSSTQNHIYSNATKSKADNQVLSLIPGDIITDSDQTHWARIRRVTFNNRKSYFDIEHNSSHSFTNDVILLPSGALVIDNVKVISPKNIKYEKMLWKIPFYQHQHLQKKAVFEGILDGEDSYRAFLKYVGIIDKLKFTLIKPAKSLNGNHLYELSISDRGNYHRSKITNIKKIFSSESYKAGSIKELDFRSGTIQSSGVWKDSDLSMKNISGVSRVCTFILLDVVKLINDGGGGLGYDHWSDCPEFRVEVWGSPIA